MYLYLPKLQFSTRAGRECVIEFDRSSWIILYYSRKVVKCRVKRVERYESVYCIYAHWIFWSVCNEFRRFSELFLNLRKSNDCLIFLIKHNNNAFCNNILTNLNWKCCVLLTCSESQKYFLYFCNLCFCTKTYVRVNCGILICSYTLPNRIFVFLIHIATKNLSKWSEWKMKIIFEACIQDNIVF